MIDKIPVCEMSMSDCVYVCQNMREDDFRETSTLTYANTKEEIAKVIFKQGGESYTIFNKSGEPVIIGGAYYENPKVATLWLLATDKISKRDWWYVTQFIIQLIDVMFKNGAANRVQAQSIGWRKYAHKWFEKLGLEKDGHLKGFAEDGYDVFLYGKIKEMLNG